jgi:hypothetical protein
VRRNFIPTLSEVQLHYRWGVDREPLVRVNNDTEQARVGVDKLGLVPGLQVVKDGCVIKVSQIGHVFAFFKLRWIDLSNISRLEHFFLKEINDLT